MVRYYHVSSARNRESIRKYGLDWRRMGVARGIAGSHQPEQEGCFVVWSEFEADWFVGFDNGCGPVDVWEVLDVDPGTLLESPEHYYYFPGVIPAERVRLLRSDLPQGDRAHRRSG